MTKKQEIELARQFFDHVFDEVDMDEDVVYEFIDPECKYDDLCDKLNNDTVREVIEMGFKQKYGVCWHADGKEKDEGRKTR